MSKILQFVLRSDKPKTKNHIPLGEVGITCHNEDIPSMSELTEEELIEFDKEYKKCKEDYEADSAKAKFENEIRNNKVKEERVKAERAEANRNVTKAYRLKK